MTPFSANIAPWQNFYLLVGGASATLVGLMFVAVTFGANMITKETSATARAFFDPTFSHFVQILFTACVTLIPSMSHGLLGAIVVVVAVLRTLSLIRVFGHMMKAHRVYNDIEFSDWTMGVAVPFACYLALGAAGIGFVEGRSFALDVLAVVTVVTLLNGIFGAWELMVWMAMTHAERKEKS
jgi:hypothetical protein